jgi:hypothetical protein
MITPTTLDESEEYTAVVESAIGSKPTLLKFLSGKDRYAMGRPVDRQAHHGSTFAATMARPV